MAEHGSAGAGRLARPAAGLSGPCRGEGADRVELFAALRMNEGALFGLHVDGCGAHGEEEC